MRLQNRKRFYDWLLGAIYFAFLIFLSSRNVSNGSEQFRCFPFLIDLRNGVRRLLYQIVIFCLKSFTSLESCNFAPRFSFLVKIGWSHTTDCVGILRRLKSRNRATSIHLPIRRPICMSAIIDCKLSIILTCRLTSSRTAYLKRCIYKFEDALIALKK